MTQFNPNISEIANRKKLALGSGVLAPRHR